MEKYVEMISPFTGGKVKEIRTVEEQVFRKETYSVHVRYYVCVDTGERFTTTDQDELMFNELYSQYRIRHGIPFPSEIKEIRERYGLNYSQMSKILGFGINQYAQYENGQIPSESNGKMILAAQKKEVMLQFLEATKAEYESAEYERIKQAICQAPECSKSADSLSLFYGELKRSIYNGFGLFNTNKLAQMVKFFIHNEGAVYPTKLNKEMFYADFFHYKQYGISISGLNYQAIKYGPVPVHYDTIYDHIGGVEKEIVFSHDMPSTRLSCSGYDAGVFNEKEMDTLTTVLNRIKPMKTAEIVELSHREHGWLNYEAGNHLIPYSEAFDLLLF